MSQQQQYLPRQQKISVDSRRRSTGANVNNFDYKIDLIARNKFNRCCVLQAEVPKSWLHLDALTNTTYSITESVGALTLTSLVLPSTTAFTYRNYTATEWATEVSTRLTALSATGANSFTYTCVYDANTGLMTITKSGAGTFTVNFTNNYELAKYTGLTQGINSSVALVLTGPNMANLQRYDVIYLKSNMGNNSGDTTIAELYVNDFADLDVISFTASSVSGYSVAMSGMTTNFYSFSLLDYNNIGISLSGVDWRAIIVCYQDDDSKPLLI